MKEFSGTAIPTTIIAQVNAQACMSPCLSKRGAVIWSEIGLLGDRPEILGVGRNDKAGTLCTSNAECKRTCRYEAVHAEQMALLRAIFQYAYTPYHPQKHVYAIHAKVKDGNLIPSGPPSCVQCSKLLLTSSIYIDGVYLYHEAGWRYYPIYEFHMLSTQNSKEIHVAPLTASPHPPALPTSSSSSIQLGDGTNVQDKPAGS